MIWKEYLGSSSICLFCLTQDEDGTKSDILILDTWTAHLEEWDLISTDGKILAAVSSEERNIMYPRGFGDLETDRYL